ACVVVDLVSNPAEIVLVDDNVPQAWHTFQVDVPAGDDIGPVLVSPLQTVLRFYKRRRDTQFDSSPVFLATEQPLSARTASALRGCVLFGSGTILALLAALTAAYLGLH